jgi:hypothetical protein
MSLELKSAKEIIFAIKLGFNKKRSLPSSIVFSKYAKFLSSNGTN